MRRGNKFKDETGSQYDRLLVIEEAGRSKFGNVLWLCSCVCGNEVIVQGAHLRNGGTKSCGCLRRERIIEATSGENNHNWKGGHTYGPKGYGPEFNENFKESIRKRDLYACQICGKPQEDDKHGHALDVHHIDYDKLNTTSENCIALCRSCHAKTRFNREYWYKYFQDRRQILVTTID